MKSVMVSIKPEYCSLIVDTKKTVEVRKTKPKLDTPFKCYIYCTKSAIMDLVIKNGKSFTFQKIPTHVKDQMHESYVANGYIIGEFICDRIHEFQVFENGSVQDWWLGDLDKACLQYNEVAEYVGKGKKGYGWKISNLIVYDSPKELSNFTSHCNQFKQLTHPPQSWCYVEELTVSKP